MGLLSMKGVWLFAISPILIDALSAKRMPQMMYMGVNMARAGLYRADNLYLLGHRK